MISIFTFVRDEQTVVLTLESDPDETVTGKKWEGDPHLQTELKREIIRESELVDGWIASAHQAAQEHGATLSISHEGDDWLMPSEVE